MAARQPAGRTPTFFALCRPGDDTVIKRLALAKDVQAKMADLFSDQREDFEKTFDIVTPWNGEWTPDEDEALSIELTEDAKAMVQKASASALATELVNPKKFEEEKIKAIFTTERDGRGTTVLVQRFSAQQLLLRKFSLLLAGTVFTELTDPAFSLDTSLACVIKDEKIIFKSFQKIRSIFDLTQFYREATDQEIEAFVSHKSLHDVDLAALQTAADQTVRKLVTRVHSNGVLDQHSVDKIRKAAGTVGIAIVVKGGQIVLPTERRELKDVLRVLDDDIYEAPLSSARYISNSKKPVR